MCLHLFFFFNVQTVSTTLFLKLEAVDDLCATSRCECCCDCLRSYTVQNFVNRVIVTQSLDLNGLQHLIVLFLLKSLTMLTIQVWLTAAVNIWCLWCHAASTVTEQSKSLRRQLPWMNYLNIIVDLLSKQRACLRFWWCSEHAVTFRSALAPSCRVGGWFFLLGASLSCYGRMLGVFYLHVHVCFSSTSTRLDPDSVLVGDSIQFPPCFAVSRQFHSDWHFKGVTLPSITSNAFGATETMQLTSCYCDVSYLPLWRAINAVLTYGCLACCVVISLWKPSTLPRAQWSVPSVYSYECDWLMNVPARVMCCDVVLWRGVVWVFTSDVVLCESLRSSSQPAHLDLSSVIKGPATCQ